MVKKFHPIHPLLFATLPAIFLWGQNFGEVPFREVIPTIAILLAVGGLAWIVSRLFFRDFQKRALLSSLFLIMTLSFGYIYNIFFYNSVIQLRFRWAFVILFIIFILFFYILKKTKKDLSGLNKVISLAVGIFILISLVQVALGYYGVYSDRKGDNVEIIDAGETDSLRDIYYIILDGYTSPEVIRDVLGLEEVDQTVSFLEDKGFFVAKQSQSNYPGTLLSLPSSLNMRYLKDPGADKRHFDLAENHEVKDVLKSFGYKYIHFGTDAFTYFNRYADKNINIGLFSPYQSLLWHNTILKPTQDLTGVRLEGFAEKVGFLDSRVTQWEREKFKLKRLAEVSNKENSPIFALAHFLIPKGAYVFDVEGNFVTEEEAREKGNLKSYLDQVQYINKEIENLIEALLRSSETDPIVIIQGDHGFPFYNNLDIIDQFRDPVRARELVVPGKYSFPILNAYYFPDGGSDLLYNSITPVNTFRLLFNHYFNQDLDLLEDISYTVDPDDETKFIIWDK